MHFYCTETRIGIFVCWMLAVGCGAGRPTELPGDPTRTPADGGEDSSNAGSIPDSDSGPAEQFTSGDAVAGDAFDCKPGTYAGTFETTVSSDAGGLLAFFSFSFKGTLSIVVVGRVSQGTGEVPQTAYAIAPGAKLTGTDQTFGGSYVADLTATGTWTARL